MPKFGLNLVQQRFQLHETRNSSPGFGEQLWPYLVIISQLTGILLVALLLVWLINTLGGFAWDGLDRQFNVHPLCMVLGMVFVNGEVLLVGRKIHIFILFTYVFLINTVFKMENMQKKQIVLMLLAKSSVIKNIPDLLLITCVAFNCFVISYTLVPLLSYRIFRNDPKIVIKSIHAVLHVLIFILSVVGLVAVWQFHNKKNIKNMYSLHSWCGLITVILFSMQLLIGTLLFVFHVGGERLRSDYLRLHTYFGCVIFVMAIGTSLIGINEKLVFVGEYTDLKPTAALGNCLGLILVVFGIIVLFMLSNSTYKRKPEPGSYNLSAMGGDESEEEQLKSG